MAVLGGSGQPGYSYFAYNGTGNPNMVAERLTAPSKIRIVTLGAWLGGWNETCPAKLCVWALDGTLLGASAIFTVANEGAAGDGNTSSYTQNLVTPVVVDSGVEFYVGSSRDRNRAMQWGTGSTGTDHYRSVGFEYGDFGSVDPPTTHARRIGAWVADYQPVSAAWVYRSGIWVQSQSFQVRRSSAWVDASSVQVRRGSVWEDAG